VASDSSFDVVSKVDRQEVDNALQQTAKELAQRFDFRGTGATIAWAGELAVELQASTEDRVKAALDVFKDKLVRRGVSLKALDAAEPRASGKVYKVAASLQNGLTAEQARQVAKVVREGAPKSIRVAVQKDEVRVSGKSRDDLQATIALLKGEDFEFAVQFVNYRG
jgi:uncharacterized protein YajQ (UPF0234 family)